MTDPVPSKEKLSDWLRRWYALKGELRFREAADEIDRLQVIEKLYNEQCDAGYARGSAAEPGPTHFAFLIKRPRDKEAWPTIFASREGAEGYEHRASPVVPVCLAQPPGDEQ